MFALDDTAKVRGIGRSLYEVGITGGIPGRVSDGFVIVSQEGPEGTVGEDDLCVDLGLCTDEHIRAEDMSEVEQLSLVEAVVNLPDTDG